MIARVNDVPAVECQVRRSAAKPGLWQWVAGPAILLAALISYFASTNAQSSTTGNSAAGNSAAVLEYLRVELPKQQGLLDEPHRMLVEVFDPATGTWNERRKDHVKPGEEFRAVNMLFKQVMYDGLSEIHGEVDVENLDDAYAAFDPKESLNLTPDDVVYVLGEQLPDGGFHMLGYLGPDRSFRFQGRIFKTEPGSRPDTIRVVDTGKTFTRPGGDPDARPPLLIRTAYTDKFFPDPKLPQSESTEDDEQ